MSKARSTSSKPKRCVVIGVGSMRPDCMSRNRRLMRSLPPGHRPVWIALSFIPSPNGVERELQRVRVLAVVADVRHPTAGLGDPDARLERLREAERLDRGVHALAAGEVHDLLDRVALGEVDDVVGAEPLGELLALRPRLDGDDLARAQSCAPIVAQSPTGPWAKTATVSPNWRYACSAPMKPVESMSHA